MRSSEPDDTITPEATPKKENFFINILCNILIPTLILSKASGDDMLGPTAGLIVALAFPLAYGLLDFKQRQKVNFFSVLGIISVLLTGTISLLRLPPEYIAIKEAAIPALIALVIFVSTYTPYPIVEKLILNEALFDVPKLQQSIASNNQQFAFAKRLRGCSLMMGGSFVLSAVLNYALATYLVTSTPGTEAYNAELGKMTALSFPVIALPLTVLMMGILFYLLRSIQTLTGQPMDTFMHTKHGTQ